MKSPPQVQIPVDPMQKAQEAQAQQDTINAMQVKLQGDTSAIMAKYGALSALNGGAPSGVSK